MVLEDNFPQMHANVEKHWDVLFSLLYAAFVLGKRISSEALKPLLNRVIWQICFVTPKYHRAGRCWL